MKIIELKQIIREEIQSVLKEDNTIKVDGILGIFNDNHKKGKLTRVEYKGKTYDLISFLGLNLKTISFITNKGEKSFKLQDIFTLI
jgi:hypothetical protein